jgi:putative transcriptional regulator
MNKRRKSSRINRKNGAQETSVEAEILEALSEFSDALEKRQVSKRFTCRYIELDLEPTQYDAGLVRKTRRILGVSQPLFARFLGVSPKTVRSWEQGVNPPQPMARRFMDEIRRHPSYWKDRLREATVVRA